MKICRTIVFQNVSQILIAWKFPVNVFSLVSWIFLTRSLSSNWCFSLDVGLSTVDFPPWFAEWLKVLPPNIQKNIKGLYRKCFDSASLINFIKKIEQNSVKNFKIIWKAKMLWTTKDPTEKFGIPKNTDNNSYKSDSSSWRRSGI